MTEAAVETFSDSIPLPRSENEGMVILLSDIPANSGETPRLSLPIIMI